MITGATLAGTEAQGDFLPQVTTEMRQGREAHPEARWGTLNWVWKHQFLVREQTRSSLCAKKMHQAGGKVRSPGWKGGVSTAGRPPRVVRRRPGREKLRDSGTPYITVVFLCRQKGRGIQTESHHSDPFI